MIRGVAPVVLEPRPEGGDVVTVPSLPGCGTQGQTQREARRMATDAFRAHRRSLRRDGEPLPRDIRHAPVHERIDVTLAPA